MAVLHSEFPPHPGNFTALLSMLNKLAAFYQRHREVIVPPLVFLAISVYTYVAFFVAPYPGFEFNRGSGQVTALQTVQNTNPRLKVGDYLEKIGPASLEEFKSNAHLALFQGYRPGEQVPLVVRRGNQRFTLNWTMVGPTVETVRTRLMDVWWLAYVFWAFGTAAYLFVRPRDRRWALLVAFNYLTGIWIASGVSSMWAVWGSDSVFRTTLWFGMAVGVHLHWVIPRPLAKTWRWAPWLGYLAGAALSAAGWFQVLPASALYYGVFLATTGCLGLLIAHYIRQPDVRRTTTMLLSAAVFALLPAGIFSLIHLANQTVYSSLIVATLPILPGMYFYTLYRRQAGGSELRANRIISLYLFLIAVGTAVITALSALHIGNNSASTASKLEVVIALVISLVAALTYPRFERWVQERLLGIPIPPSRLMVSFAAQIATSPDPQQLVELLRDMVLPSLMVRQSALLTYDDAGKLSPLYVDDLDGFSIPWDACLQKLLEGSGQYRSPVQSQADHPSLAWVRLVIPLVAGNRQVGIWILGRRDPDDLYAQAEIPTFQALADQTAIALLNHKQAEYLSRLYQADIDRQEDERLQLALELHDGVLNQLGILALAADQRNATFENAYQLAATNIRQIISGLRPTMLNYGLRTALDELADEAPSQAKNPVEIYIEVPETEIRYPSQVELHLYRIAQEACKNAIQHAQASAIHISGSLQASWFDLVIADDGKGFQRSQQLNLNSLLEQKHFGLAGMIERAQLIGARMEISSTPGKGTRVRVFGRATAC